MPPSNYHRFVRAALLVFLQVFLFHSFASGQSPEQFFLARAYFDRTYGSDYNLLNGRQYYLYYSSNSHPFLNTEQSLPGGLVIRGMSYQGVPINYDLFQQEVILQYITSSGETRHVILNRELVDEFILDDRVFRSVQVDGRQDGYAQVIEAGGLSFYIFYIKKLNYTPSTNTTPYHYTRASKRIYLDTGEHVSPVSSRNSFLQLFEPGQLANIKQFMRRGNLRLKKATDAELKALLDYCSQLDGGKP